MALQLESASQSPEGLVKTQVAGRQQNGAVGSSKLLSLHRNVKKRTETVRTNFAKILVNIQRFTATKWILNQEKDSIQTVGELCGIFTCPCPTPVTAQWQFWRRQFIFPMWGQRSPGSGGSGANLLYKLLCMSCLGLPGGPVQALVPVTPNSELS